MSSSKKKSKFSKRRRRSSSSSLSAESTGHNEDLMTHIALYLPVKSILRFRSVSKQWYSLLTHPRFILSHKAKKQMIFFQMSNIGFRGIEYLYLNGNNHNLHTADFNYLQYPSQYTLHLKRSSNGLLLLESHNFFLGNGQPRRRRFYVCNPSTRKHSELALPDYIELGKGSVIANLAFDPSVSPFYKVVFFWNSNWNSSYYDHISIYSSETKACRKITHTFKKTPEFFAGAICWADNLRNETLYYFDINQESINVLPKPPYSGSRDYGEFRGHLNMILHDSKKSLQGFIDVYELKEDYSSWVAKYKVDLDAIAVDFPQIIYRNENSEKYYMYDVLCVLDNEEAPTIVLSILKASEEQEPILTYNLIDKTTKKLTSLRGWTKAVHCTETLFGV